MSIRILAFLLVVLVSVSCNKGFNKVLKSTDAGYKLKVADSLFTAQKYQKAQLLYEELFPVYKGSEKFEELYYKYAYTFYNQKLFEQAEAMYKGYLEFFPNSPRAQEMAYMQAFMLYKQSPKLELEQVNTLKAMNAMQTFIVNNPGSNYIPEATRIIDELRGKLEAKAARNAQLYFDIGQYRAAAVAYDNVLLTYPESVRGEEYKLLSIKSYYEFAEMSFIDKQIERYEKVMEEYENFVDLYPESKKLKEAEELYNLSKNKINKIRNEQIAQTVQQ